MKAVLAFTSCAHARTSRPTSRGVAARTVQQRRSRSSRCQVAVRARNDDDERDVASMSRRACGGSLLMLAAAAAAEHLQPAAAAAVAYGNTAASPGGADMMADTKDAIITIIDARNTLAEIADLAATPIDSEERCRYVRQLPLMARRLVEVNVAAPLVTKLIASRDAGLSDAMVKAAQDVLQPSGRGFLPEALTSPALATSGFRLFDDVIRKIPSDQLAKATEVDCMTDEC